MTTRDDGGDAHRFARYDCGEARMILMPMVVVVTMPMIAMQLTGKPLESMVLSLTVMISMMLWLVVMQ